MIETSVRAFPGAEAEFAVPDKAARKLFLRGTSQAGLLTSNWIAEVEKAPATMAAACVGAGHCAQFGNFVAVARFSRFDLACDLTTCYFRDRWSFFSPKEERDDVAERAGHVDFACEAHGDITARETRRHEATERRAELLHGLEP